MRASGSRFQFIVPGPIDRRTGGSIYDNRISKELPKFGWVPEIVELDGAYPLTDASAEDACATTVGDLPQNARMVLDGWAAPPFVAHLDSRPDVTLALLSHHPVILEPGWSADELSVLKPLEAAAFQRAELVIAPSRRTLDDAAAAGYRISKGHVVQPGSDPVELLQIRAVPGTPAKLLCVANLIPRKGHDVLLEALSRLSDLPLQLTCVGSELSDPEWTGKLQKSAVSYGLEGRVTFAGEVGQEELSALYRAADIFVLPSRHEGFGMVFSEALRWGLPLIATDAGATREAAPDDAAIFVPVDDPLALAKAIRTLLEDRDAYATIAAAAAAAGRVLPDWETSGKLFAAALSAAWCRR